MPLDPKQITRRRDKLKLTMLDAAERAEWGRGPRALSRWAQLEAEPDDPPLSVVEAVARVLGCKVDDLLKRKD